MTRVRARRAVKQTKRRVYKNPPISEAVCEFQFSNPDDWNIACSGLLYERVKKRYNGKPREQRLLRIEGPPATPQQDNAQRVMEITKVQFPSAQQQVSIGGEPIGTIGFVVEKNAPAPSGVNG